MKIALYNQKAEKIGDVELADKMFDAKLNEHLVAEASRIQSSNARKGLSHTKTRGEVSGGGKKPWKQKGTGRARAGSNRSPIWRHGGVTFGPRSARNWELKLNKKAKLSALYSVLSDKVRSGKFIVIDKIELATPKTKEFAAVMDTLRAGIKDMGKKHLLLLPKGSTILSRASRNLPSVRPIPAHTLSILDILKNDSVVVLQDSIKELNTTFNKS